MSLLLTPRFVLANFSREQGQEPYVNELFLRLCLADSCRECWGDEMMLHIMGLMKITSYFLQGSVLCSFFSFVLSKLILKVRSLSVSNVVESKWSLRQCTTDCRWLISYCDLTECLHCSLCAFSLQNLGIQRSSGASPWACAHLCNS